MQERLAAGKSAADSTLPDSDEMSLRLQAAQGDGGEDSVRMLALALRRLRHHGDSLPDESRILVGPVESQGTRLFAIPTTAGHVGFFAFRKHDGGGMGSVAWVLDRGMTWWSSWTSRGDVIDLVVFGLLGDDVTSIAVELEDGSTHSAQIGENGFLLEAQTATHDIKRFRLDYRDGTGISVEPKRRCDPASGGS